MEFSGRKQSTWVFQYEVVVCAVIFEPVSARNSLLYRDALRTREVLDGVAGIDSAKRADGYFANALQRLVGGSCKIHCEVAGAEIAPELLAEQRLDIGFVVDHEYDETHVTGPAFARDATARGSTTLNSVNSPG